MPLSQGSRVGLTGLLALVATYALGRQAFGPFVPTFREEFGLSLDVLGLYASGIALVAEHLWRTVWSVFAAIGFIAAGFIIGPTLFGVLTTYADNEGRWWSRPSLPCWSH